MPKPKSKFSIRYVRNVHLRRSLILVVAIPGYTALLLMRLIEGLISGSIDLLLALAEGVYVFGEDFISLNKSFAKMWKSSFAAKL
jgi:hypothetical protein